MLINIPEAGNLSIHKIYKKLEKAAAKLEIYPSIKYIRSWKKPARNLKIFSHKILRIFLFFRKSIYPILFLFFIFKSNQQNRTIASPKYSISTPSHSHFNFIFSSSFSFRAPPYFSQYIPPKHLYRAIHPFIHHFALNNIKTFLSSSL